MILEYAGLSIRILVKEQAHDYLLLKVAGAWALIIKSVAGRVFHRPREDFRPAEELEEVCLGPGTNDAMRANSLAMKTSSDSRPRTYPRAKKRSSRNAYHDGASCFNCTRNQF